MELNTAGINTNTVSITDYKIVAAKLARVIVAFTGDHTRDTIAEAIADQTKHMAAVVESSFRIIKDNVAVGFLRANTEVRVVNDVKELRASYKTMVKTTASNILMDNKDRTLWELKEGAGGKFLARHGNEDLSELIGAAVNHRNGVPKLHQLAMASVAKREFVAFASASGDMDYGFCVASSEAKQALKVVSATTGTAVVIPNDAVVSVIPVGGAKIPLSAHKRILEAGISREDAKQEVEYYTRLYSYAPDYLAEVIRQVEGTATM